METLKAAQIFPTPKKITHLDNLTIADVFELTLNKLPPDTKLRLVYGVPESLNREEITALETIELLTPIFRGKIPENTIKIGYRAYPDATMGALHFIDLTLNPEHWVCGHPVTEGRNPYRTISILYEEKKA